MLLLIPRRESGVVLPYVGSPSKSNSKGSGNSSEGERDDDSNEKKVGRRRKVPMLPSLTTYRAHMLLLTFICILAVDFPVFPRNLVKCETYGVSLVSFLFCFVLSPILVHLTDGSVGYQDGFGCWVFCVLTRTCICVTYDQKPEIPH